MSCLGNLIWFIFGGWLTALSWFGVGLLWCITIVGIPVGVQCFKFAKLFLFPFGKDIQFTGGGGSVLINVLWLLLGGLALAAEAAVIGLIYCITIVGIPFGLQYFKIARLALMPVGSQIR